MTKKKKRMRLGREIRRKTGISFPLAMVAARALVRGDAHKIATDKRFANLIVGSTTTIDQEEYSSWSIVGEWGAYYVYYM